MTDAQTRRALDELADLYLTGPEPVRLDASRDRRNGSNGSVAAIVSPPLRLSSAPGPAPAVAPAIQALLLGHLPGYASPWVSQYAHHVGASHGGAVLIRIHGQVAELELFSDVKLPPQGGVLSETLEQLAAAASAWIVLIDEPASGAAAKRLRDLPRWTMLSGADDAAVVGGYRLLKGLLHDAGGTPPIDGLGVMFMGCEEADAAEALERLNRAASAFLKAPIESAGTRQRMQPVRRRYIGHYDIPAGRDPWSVIGPFLCELAESGEPGGPREPGPVDVELEHLEQAAEALHVAPAALAAEVLAPASAAALDDDMVRFSAVMFPEIHAVSAAAVAVEQRVEPEAVDVAELAVAPVELTEDAKPQAAVELEAAVEVNPTLAGRLGAEPLAARCPRQPQVELALDAAGVVHLLLRIAVATDPNEALRRLMQVRAWATEHRELLALTCPRKFDPTAAPQMHLFTANVSPALSLADLGVHIHLLRTITVAGCDIEVHEQLR